MSAITSIQTRGMLEAYQAVHSPELRAQLDEENKLVEQVGIDMIENAAYVLFSQGYDVDDVISYFTEATTNTIIKDYLNFSEGNLIIESVAVSDAYIEEQFQELNEGLLSAVRGGVQRVLGAGAGSMKGGGGIRDAAGAMLKSGTRAAKQTLGRAATGAKDLIKKIPGAGTAQKFAKSGAGKLLGKVGSRVLPGIGVAAYGMDAVDRAKKGDWGGAALSGIGAGLSAIPGVGLVAGLAPTAIQMATDAAGLTGDKSKKGSAKTIPPAPLKPPSLKNNQDYAKSKQRYFSSSDGKTYKNFNDAQAAKNSRISVKPKPATPAPAAAAPSTPSYSTLAKPEVAPTKPSTKVTKLPQIKKDEDGFTETQGNPDTKIDTKSVEASIATANDTNELNKPAPENSALAKEQERRKRQKEEPQETSTETTSEGYDAYNLVLEYLLSQGHTETIEEAHYVMMEMDEEMIGSIVEQYIT